MPWASISILITWPEELVRINIITSLYARVGSYPDCLLMSYLLVEYAPALRVSYSNVFIIFFVALVSPILSSLWSVSQPCLDFPGFSSIAGVALENSNRKGFPNDCRSLSCFPLPSQSPSNPRYLVIFIARSSLPWLSTTCLDISGG